MAKTRATFPDAYKETFTRYTIVDLPGTKQVRHFYANGVALAAAREGRDLPDGSVLLGEIYSAKLGADKNPATGPDGRLVADQIVGCAVMARNAGWGKDIPEILRNADWNYGAFNPDLTVRTAANQAECLACHKPLPQDSYLFSIKQLREAALKKN